MKDSDKTAFFNEDDIRRIQQEASQDYAAPSAEDEQVTQVIDISEASQAVETSDPEATQVFDPETTQVIASAPVPQEQNQAQDYNNPNMTMQMSPVYSAPQPDIAQQQANFSGHEQYAKPKGAKRFFRIFLLSLLIVAGIGAATAFITYELNLWGGVFVPNVEGKTMDEAKADLESAGFQVELHPTKSDENINKVYSSNPEQGTKALPNSKVFLYYYTQRTIPKVVGLDVEEAKRKLNEDGYTDIREEKVTSSATNDSVLEISPSEGTAAKASMRIKLRVAENTKMPDLIGKTEDEAKSILAAAGIKVNVQYEMTTSKTAGTVISTDPSAGKTVNTTYSVTIVVARAPSGDTNSSSSTGSGSKT